MAFQDIPVIKRLDKYNEAILLHTNKSKKSFINEYQVSIPETNIPVGYWFVYLSFMLNGEEDSNR